MLQPLLTDLANEGCREVGMGLRGSQAWKHSLNLGEIKKIR
jgi:hypothetical protein